VTRSLKGETREAPEEALARQDRRVPSFLTLLGHPMLLSGAWAAADQALISGTNLFTMLLMARAVAPSQFGTFVLAYAGLWVFQNVQRALIVEPLNVLGAKKEGSDYRRYVTSSAALQAIFAVLVASALLASGTLALSVQSLLFALALAVVCWQMQEFVRRVFYTRTYVGRALINDSISYGGQVVLLTALYVQGALTPVSALVAVAITSAIAVVVGGWQVRSHMGAGLSIRSLREAATDNWRFGRWLLGTNPLWDLGNRFYLFLLAAFVGPAGLGAFTAAITMSRVSRVLLQALDTLLPPIAARRFEQRSQAGMETLLMAVTLIGIVPVLLSMIFLMVFAQEVLHMVYGGAYDEFASVLRIVSLTSLSALLLTLLRVALKAIEETRVLFVASAVSAAFLVTGGSFLAAVAGVTGAAWVSVINGVITLGVVTIGYWTVTRRRPARNPRITEPVFLERHNGGVSCEIQQVAGK
jgi:O-antigen/teichoic acid export membrane protein